MTSVASSKPKVLRIPSANLGSGINPGTNSSSSTTAASPTSCAKSRIGFPEMRKTSRFFKPKIGETSRIWLFVRSKCVSPAKSASDEMSVMLLSRRFNTVIPVKPASGRMVPISLFSSVKVISCVKFSRDEMLLMRLPLRSNVVNWVKSLRREMSMISFSLSSAVLKSVAYSNPVRSFIWSPSASNSAKSSIVCRKKSSPSASPSD